MEASSMDVDSLSDTARNAVLLGGLLIGGGAVLMDAIPAFF